ncbi:MAG: hypothetical protein WDN66_05680 [Candidatus Saccharibacteria bacterium]
MAKDTQVIGSTTTISIPAGGIVDLPAKVDTGADSSSIWASDIKGEKWCLAVLPTRSFLKALQW